MAIDLAEFVTKDLRGMAAMWAKDLAAHRPEEFCSSPSEKVRSVADFSYETLFVNRRLIARVTGEPVLPMDGFPSCPEELCTPEAMAAALTESVEQFIAAMGDPEREIVRPDGTILTAFELGSFMNVHMMYHLGQINYVQTLCGDGDVHWM